jgi:hypothetical protein
MARQMLQGSFQLKWLFGEVYHTFLSHRVKIRCVEKIKSVQKTDNYGIFRMEVKMPNNCKAGISQLFIFEQLG